jgi:hypothetical protein
MNQIPHRKIYIGGYTPDRHPFWLSRPFQATQILNGRLPSSGSLDHETTNHTRDESQSTYNRDSHEALLGDLIIDEPPKAGSLEVCGFLLQKQIVVSAGFAIIA